MNALLPIACPLCTLSSPTFVVLSVCSGTVPVTYFLLRPYTRQIKSWGTPRVDTARIVSLAMMVACLIPAWLIGRIHHPIMHVSLCLMGLLACCVYLWLRACWLLDEHHVTSAGKELVFPGILAPVLLVFGTTIGSWGLGVLSVAPIWPTTILSHTFWSAMVAAPTGLLAVAGLNYAFRITDTNHSGKSLDSATPTSGAATERGATDEPPTAQD